MQTLPCWLCGKQLDVRVTKNGKLYVICDEDGVQCFVRRHAGMNRLKRLMKTLEKGKHVFSEQTEELFAIQAILKEMDVLKEEIEKLNAKAGFLFEDTEMVRARDALQARLNRLLKELEKRAAS